MRFSRRRIPHHWQKVITKICLEVNKLRGHECTNFVVLASVKLYMLWVVKKELDIRACTIVDNMLLPMCSISYREDKKHVIE